MNANKRKCFIVLLFIRVYSRSFACNIFIFPIVGGTVNLRRMQTIERCNVSVCFCFRVGGKIKFFFMQTRTKRQKQVYDFIKQYIDKHGYEPSYQQIAWHLGVRSKAGVAKHIAALESQGLINRRNDNGSFNLELTNNQVLSDSVCEIEWLDGNVAPDNPEPWQTVPLVLPRFMLGDFLPENLFAFMVRNNAMSGDEIFDGDVAIIERRSFVRDGNIIAAQIGGKQTVLKKYYRAGAEIELRPSNNDYDILKFAADKVTIRGIFRGVLRPLG